MGMRRENASDELAELAVYVEGLLHGLDASGNSRSTTRLLEVKNWLDRASQSICAQGYFGCRAGRGCTSEHK